MSRRQSQAEFSLPGLWPSEAQQLVLRAALLEPEPACRAFDVWVKTIDLDKDFDQGTFRLLPLLYDNLLRAGVDHPLMGRLKGVYRRAWYKNHKLFDRMRPVVEALHEAQIPTMLLKGAPLVLHYYGNHALRPMADIDVLVPTEMVRRAIDVLRPFPLTQYAIPTADYLKYRHALSFDSADGLEFDLHWHALYEFCDSGADEVFWRTARELDFCGVRTRAPDPTRILLHTILHGIRWNNEPPIRWTADAMTVLKKAGAEIDWEELVTLARERDVSHRMRLGLEFLHQRLDAPVPPAVLARFARLRTTWVQRAENTCILTDARKLYARPLGHVWLIFADYCRYARTASPIAFALGFPHYLRFRLGLRGRWEIVGVVIRGLWKRLRRALGVARRAPAGAE